MAREEYVSFSWHRTIPFKKLGRLKTQAGVSYAVQRGGGQSLRRFPIFSWKPSIGVNPDPSPAQSVLPVTKKTAQLPLFERKQEMRRHVSGKFCAVRQYGSGVPFKHGHDLCPSFQRVATFAEIPLTRRRHFILEHGLITRRTHPDAAVNPAHPAQQPRKKDTKREQ